MRRLALALLLAAFASVAFGAVGGDPRHDEDKTLGYLPAGGVLTATVSTDIDGEEFRTLDLYLVKRLLGFRVAPFLEDVADDFDLLFDREVRPQLGNDLAVAVRWSLLTGDSEEGIVAALQVKDPAALRRVLDGQRDLRVDGTASNARLYAGAGSREAFLALEDDVLVAADSERRLLRALARHDSRAGLDSSRFRAALRDLRRDAPVRLVADFRQLLAQRSFRRFRRVPWLNAIHTMRATIGVSRGRMRLEGALETDPARIGPGDLPVLPGTDPPALVRSGRQFSSGSVNQSQTTAFLLRAARAAFPRSRFVRDVRRLERAHRLNFENEVLRQFNGPSATLMLPDGRFGARSVVRDPRRLARTIRRLAPDLGRVIQDLEALEGQGLALLLMFAPDAPVSKGVLGRSRVKVRRLSGQRDFYRLSGLRRGPLRVYFGLHKGVFVVGSSERRAKAMATAPAAKPTAVPGTSAVRANLGGMREQLEHSFDIDPGRLGELVGYLNADRSRLRGSLSVALP